MNKEFQFEISLGWAIYFSSISNDSVALWRRWKFDGVAVLWAHFSHRSCLCRLTSQLDASLVAKMSRRFHAGGEEKKSFDWSCVRSYCKAAGKQHMLLHADKHFSGSTDNLQWHKQFDLGNKDDFTFYGSDVLKIDRFNLRRFVPAMLTLQIYTSITKGQVHAVWRICQIYTNILALASVARLHSIKGSTLK